MVSLWAVTVFTAPSNRPLGQEEKARHGPAFHCTGTRSTWVPNMYVYMGGGSTEVRTPGWEWIGDAEQGWGGSTQQGHLSRVRRTAKVSPENGGGMLGAGRSIMSPGKRCTKSPAVWGPGQGPTFLGYREMKSSLMNQLSLTLCLDSVFQAKVMSPPALPVDIWPRQDQGVYSLLWPQNCRVKNGYQTQYRSNLGSRRKP